MSLCRILSLVSGIFLKKIRFALRMSLYVIHMEFFLAPSKAPEKITIDSLISHNSIHVSWQALDAAYIHGDLKGYKVLYSLKRIGGKAMVIEKTETVDVHPSLNKIKLNGLQSNAQYKIQVQAFNENGEGAMSKAYFGGKFVILPY